MDINSQPKVLVADDDSNTRRVIARSLARADFQVVEAGDGVEAKDKLDASVAVALFDLRMPRANGIDCLLFAKERFPDTVVIILSSYGGVDDVIKAMKHGAFWFLEKPFERDDLLALVGVAAELFDLKCRNRMLEEVVSRPGVEPTLVAESDQMKTLLARLNRVAALDATVLITGASGTGKTTVARLIHQQSSRREGPFVSVSCAAIPRDLIEAELFGHEKGAFTGAVQRRLGSIGLAAGGTLFLDEIGEMPLDLQPKLLTFLQDKTVRRLGGSTEEVHDVRIVAATNRDLAAMCDHRAFREDLYYRINVLSLAVPPLSERLADIQPLAEHCLRRIAATRGEPPHRLTESALAKLRGHSWPGNVRELENVLERATAFSTSSVLDGDDIPLRESERTNSQFASTGRDFAGMTLDELERQAIVDTLRACEGHKARAAEMLGISTKSIYNKIHKYGLG